MLGLEAEEGHDAHVPYRRQVVEHGYGEVYHQLIASIGAQVEQRVVQLHVVVRL